MDVRKKPITANGLISVKNSSPPPATIDNMTCGLSETFASGFEINIFRFPKSVNAQIGRAHV